jgi:hypothetical protein
MSDGSGCHRQREIRALNMMDEALRVMVGTGTFTVAHGILLGSDLSNDTNGAHTWLLRMPA